MQANIRSLFAELLAHDEAVREGRSAVTASVEAKTVVIAQNAVGERSFFDVLNTQREFLEVERRLVQARSDRISIANQIMAAFGRLNDLARSWRDRS